MPFLGTYIKVSSYLPSAALTLIMLLTSHLTIKKYRKPSLSMMIIASFSIFCTVVTVAPNYAYAADEDGLLLNNKQIEARNNHEATIERNRKREQLKQRAEAADSNKDTDKFLQQTRQNAEQVREEKSELHEYEESKEYMSYVQRLVFTWKNAQNIQDIFDLSLPKAYAPAKVSSNFINMKSGPGEGYPTVYVAEKGELIDFTAIRTDWYEIRTADGHLGWINKLDLPNNLELLDDNFEFADEAKTIATRGSTTNIGFSSGVMSDDATASLFIQRRNSYFMSTEAELGFTRGLGSRQDYLSFNVLAHPFIELAFQPHLLIGLGQMSIEGTESGSSDTYQDSGILGKAGIGFSREFANRLRIRGDISQYSVNVPRAEFNHFTALTLGTAFTLGSSSDFVFNRSIGKEIKVTDHEVTLFTGNVNLNFIGNLAVNGIRGSYHVSEDNFFEISYSQGKGDYQHAGIAVAKNLLPTEYSFKWRDTAHFWPTQVYALVGTGFQFFENDEQVSITAGIGLRINPLRRLAVRLDARGHILQRQEFNNQVFEKLQNNPEISLGLSGYF